MNSYLDLAVEYNRNHRKKNRVIIACIAVAVCLVTAIFGMADIGIKFQTEQLKRDYGSYHISVKDIDANAASLIKNHVDVAYSGWIKSPPSVEFEGKEFRVVGGDQEAAALLGLSVVEGDYPNGSAETLVDRQALNEYGWSIGEKININMGDAGDREYRIVGVYNEFSSLKSKDKHALFLSFEGVQAIGLSEPSDYLVMFKDNVKITKATSELQSILGINEEQISKNTYLLAVMGEGGSSFATNLYVITVILFTLVLVAGCIMISNSFNISILERTKFFGLMRCLGASKKQIKKYVRREGYLFCLKAIPLGLIAGSVVVEAAIILLRELNPTLLGELRVFQISINGLVAGIIVGFLTVILSSLSPAKKASSVSPLAAVTGNLKEIDKSSGSKLGYSKHIPVELSLGIHHAFSDKKSFLLMIGSFTVSIVLFLGFSVFIDFSYLAAKPMKPSSADISIYDPTLNERVPHELLDKAEKIEGVKNVFSRKIATIPAYTSQQHLSGNTFVTSYDDLQFQWTQSTLLNGDIDIRALRAGEEILVESESDLKVGEHMVFQTELGSFETVIGGVLSSIPFETKEQIFSKVIVSDEFFTKMTGLKDYSILDIQLLNNTSELTVESIRKAVPETLSFFDLRQRNQEGQNAFYTMAIFAYGFVAIVAVITILSIINSMNISVTSRIGYYGMMRAVGASAKQLRRMVLAEALTYVVCGSLIGSVLGIILHQMLYEKLVTSYFHTPWQWPGNIVYIIMVGIIAITIISVITPLRRINKLKIVEAINFSN
ncbi:ABC transporter permease [Paenibacillus donghaensis]|uniref:ABC transporter permease n=1 Tax=Paenibacillus donghaensis TaxID=414771 RepID=A0A2Z2KQ05_9BACL|nr:FtsX-like permease family protein [Paenibacillus donghaensis]ASA22361.1 hypothetical protein B9T62_17155 [Paenibacillus donghaensis]